MLRSSCRGQTHGQMDGQMDKICATIRASLACASRANINVANVTGRGRQTEQWTEVDCLTLTTDVLRLHRRHVQMNVQLFTSCCMRSVTITTNNARHSIMGVFFSNIRSIRRIRSTLNRSFSNPRKTLCVLNQIQICSEASEKHLTSRWDFCKPRPLCMWHNGS